MLFVRNSTRMFQSRRAVSPLIATVLLIAFAVALGAVVMNWGKSYVEDTIDFAQERGNSEVRCSLDVNLRFAKIDGVTKICSGGSGASSFIYMIIENGPTVDVSDVQLQVIGQKNIYTNISLLNETLPKAHLKRINVSYDNTSYGTIDQIKLTPKVTVEGAKTAVLCQDSALTDDEVLPC